MRRMHIALILLLVITVVFGVNGCGPKAEGDFPFAKDSVIQIVVPYGAGGGYDTEARLIAPFLRDKLEEMGGANINIVVENITGGGGSIATTQVYGAPADGKTMLFLDPEASFVQQMLHDVGFDIRDFVYVGQQSYEPMSFILNKKIASQVDSFYDLLELSQKEPLLLGTCGYGNYDHFFPLMLKLILQKHDLNLDVEFVHYESTADIAASIRRGEVDGTIEVAMPFLELIDEGEAEMMFSFTDERIYPGIPSYLELPEFENIVDEESIQSIHKISSFRRVLVLPPQADEKKVEILKEAFKDAVHCDGFIQKMEEAGREVSYLNDEEISNIINTELKTAGEYEEELKKFLK